MYYIFQFCYLAFFCSSTLQSGIFVETNSKDLEEEKSVSARSSSKIRKFHFVIQHVIPLAVTVVHTFGFLLSVVVQSIYFWGVCSCTSTEPRADPETLLGQSNLGHFHNWGPHQSLTEVIHCIFLSGPVGFDIALTDGHQTGTRLTWV